MSGMGVCSCMRGSAGCIEVEGEGELIVMRRSLIAVLVMGVGCLAEVSAEGDGEAPEPLPPEIEAMLDEGGEQHMREELGVNPITAPLIRDLLNELDAFRPVPLDVIAKNRRDLTFNNRPQTALYTGALVADGFMLTLAERQADVEEVGRALLRQATALGVGERLTRRSKSILERSSRGDWIGLREELIATQAEVEDAMMELRDEEVAHLVSFGGWMRGFQLACHATARNYFPQRASGLLKPEVVEYFQERLSTLHPRMAATELMRGIRGRLDEIAAVTRECGEAPPNAEQVERMKAAADGAFALFVSPVDSEGKITGLPQFAP